MKDEGEKGHLKFSLLSLNGAFRTENFSRFSSKSHVLVSAGMRSCVFTFLFTFLGIFCAFPSLVGELSESERVSKMYGTGKKKRSRRSMGQYF